MLNQGNPGAPKLSEVEVQMVDQNKQNIVSNINNVRPEAAQADSKDAIDPILAVYHRTIEEIEKMPVIEKTMTVCPECKLIINGTIYKDGDNVMIRKYCPEHGWTIEKYWEDYDMYMKMRSYNYLRKGLRQPQLHNDTRGRTARSTAGCARGTSPTPGLPTSS